MGSGSGKFVWDLVNLGYKKTIGLDPFIDQNIKYENGAKIVKKDLSEINGSYDLITFHHTFEHFFNLKESLICVKNLLKKTGICLIRIPNIDSFSAKEFGLDWTGIHAPYHLNLPSYKAMKKLLENAELKIDQIKGEQLPHFLFSNIDNKLNLIHDTSTMFRVFTESLSKIDKKHWKKQNKILNKTPLLCEWINYYVKLR